MYKFIKTKSSIYTEDTTNIAIENINEGACIDDLLETFACFLRACGYHVDELVHLRDDQYVETDEESKYED